MSTYNLKLFFAANDGDKGQIPGALAYVAIKHAIEDPLHNETSISHQCVGPTELKAEVERLKLELDEILADGLRRFRRHRAEAQKGHD